MWVKKENLLEMTFLPNQDLHPSALDATMLLGQATETGQVSGISGGSPCTPKAP